MTLLDCAVTGCAYNEDRCCCKGNIKVEGSEAVHQNETCCGSFDENKGCLFKNVFKTPESSLSVDCEAVQCIYNDNRHCTAAKIGIAGDGASRAEQTLCTTFQMS